MRLLLPPLLMPAALFAGETATPTPRPATWATPIAVDGLPNLHRVSDSLYRCAQPSAAGMSKLPALKIKTVVSLRAFHSDRDELGATPVAYEHIFMKTWHPEREDAVRFLKIVTDPAKTPVLVHCQHGADRTGTMCAVYRMAVQGWSKADAIREMTGGDFGYHPVWKNLPAWLRDLDVDALRRDAGLPTPKTTHALPPPPAPATPAK